MKQKRLDKYLKIVIRAIFFFLYPAVFSTAFAGVKYIAEQMGKGELLTINAFVKLLIVLLLFTIFMGRFFCGYACAFGIYSDIIYAFSCWVQKKRKKRPFHVFAKQAGIMRYGKYIVLSIIIVMCLAGKAAIVTGNSPWTAFSQITNFKFDVTVYAVVLLVLVTVGMFFEQRFFCRFLCPMGAIFSWLPVLSSISVKRNRANCIPGCRACQMNCPAGIEIPDMEDNNNAMAGECFACGNCVQKCPRNNIHMGVSDKVLVMQIVKAVVLIAVLQLVG